MAIMRGVGVTASVDQCI